MTFPTWLDSNHQLAIRLLYAATPQPLTLVITPSHFTVTRLDGESYTAAATDLTPATPLVDAPPSYAEATAPAPVLSPADITPWDQLPPEPTASPPTSPPQTHEVSSSVATPAAPSPQSSSPPPHRPAYTTRWGGDPEYSLEDLLADINNTHDGPVPSLGIPQGAATVQVEYVLDLYDRVYPNFQDNYRLLHVCYELGRLRTRYREIVDACFQRRYPRLCLRQRRRRFAVIRRIYQVFSRIGLPRLYGTAIFQYADMRDMPRNTFDLDFYPALRDYNPPASSGSAYTTDSEDLVF